MESSRFTPSALFHGFGLQICFEISDQENKLDIIHLRHKGTENRGGIASD